MAIDFVNCDWNLKGIKYTPDGYTHDVELKANAKCAKCAIADRKLASVDPYQTWK